MTEKENGQNKGSGRVLSFKRGSSFFAKRGDAKRAQNDPISAVSMYREALDLDPLDFDTRLAAAEVLTDMSRFNDSNRILIPYMHLDEEFRRDAYCIVGFNFLGMGENEGARVCFDRFFDMTDEVSERTDAMLDAIDYMDSVEERGSNLSDAKLVDRDSKSFEAFKAVDSGDFKRAQQMLTKLCEEYPEDAEILYKLALSSLCCGDYLDADRALERLLADHPDDWGAWGMKLMCAKALRNEIEFSRVAKRLEKCDSDIPDVLLKVNGALLEAECFEQALSSAKRLFRLLPYDCIANHRLGVCYMNLGMYSKAAEIYDRLVRIDRHDRIARYYRSGCIEAAEDNDSSFIKQQRMIQYQIPVGAILDEVRSLIDGNAAIDPNDILTKWQSDQEFRDRIRWSFTIHEFNTIHAMMALLSIIADHNAEQLLREVLSDIDVSEPVINDALGVLKHIGAKEPFFVVADGKLLEGRVNVVDLSNAGIPKAYREILPRIIKKASDVYSAEVISIASSISERFIVCCLPNFKPITSDQSAALSAAIEFLACERCGVLARDDILERYEVTQKRFSNAIDRIIGAFTDYNESGSGEDSFSGHKEDE